MTTPPPPPPPSSPPPPPQPARLLKGLTCASCAGTVDVEEGLTTLTCRYCGTPQLMVGNRGVRRVMVLDEITREGAEQGVRDWFAKGIRKEPALKKEAQFSESFLAWFPFVRARCNIVGWAFGFNEERRKSGKRTITVKVPVENQVERTIDHTLPAADMAEFGVGKVNLAGDTVLPLSEDKLRRRGMLFRPNRAAPEIADEIIDKAVTQAEASARPDHSSLTWLSALRRNTTLVYYPLWIFRYSFRGRTYQVLVDAEDGTLAYGKAPGNHLWRAFAVVSACAGASFIGTSILQHAGGFLRSDGGLVGLGVIGLMLAGIVHWGYKQFRRGGVIEEGTGRITEPEKSPLKSLNDLSGKLSMD